MKRPLLYLVVTLCAVSFVHADQTIRSLQQTLKDQGFYYGTVTGEKSSETTAAIRRFQIRNGLRVTGEINDETLHSLNVSSKSVVKASRPNSKPAGTQLDTIHPDARAAISQSSPPPLFGQPHRPLETNPSYAASFFQSAPLRMNRRVIAGAQYQLISRGYYDGRVDGKYGSQTAFAVRAFQSSSGLPPTSRLDTQTLDALGLSGADLAYAAPTSPVYETWIPITKFKHGKWKVKWKKGQRGWDEEAGDEDHQANRDYGWQGYNGD